MSDESVSREQGLQHILAAYLQDAEAGKAPDLDKLLAQHPDLADDLRSFLAENDKMRDLVKQQTDAPTIGTKVRYFGDYELLEEIARGGMGVVYKARQVSLNRIVALKMILAGQLASTADVKRFHAEAEAAANLDHPNIVPIYEVGEHEGQHFFSMKFIEGGSLSPQVPHFMHDSKATARLLASVARAIHHAHQRGILHRDLKPGNILLDAQAQPHVTDFGLAKRVEGDSGQTRTGAIVGTPSYMAPEQARAQKGLTTAVDIYSLGAILYELLTGRPPFHGETAMQTLLQVIGCEPQSPASVNRGTVIDRDLETICLKCLNKDPARRYGSAEMLADDLERWLRGEPILARPASRPERLFKWARRRPERAILYGLAILVLGIGFGWIAWQGGVAIVDHWARAREERRQLLERTQNDLQTGRTSCQAGYLDVGMLFLARGLRGAVALEASDLERDLRLELGRYAPLLPRLVTMSGHGAEQIYRGEGGPRYGVSLSRDGKRLVAAGLPWSRRIHDVDALTPQMLDPAFSSKTPWSSLKYGVAISPDGSRFVYGDGAFAPDGIFAYGDGAFAPDGKRLLIRQYAARLQVPQGDPVPFLLADPATRRAVGKTLDTHMNGTVYTFKGFEAAFSPDSSLIAFTESFGVRLLDAVTGVAREPALHVGGRGSAFAFSPDSKLLAIVSSENENQIKDGADADKKHTWTVRLWDVKTGKQNREPLLLSLLHFSGVNSLTFSPDGKLLLMKLGQSALQIWDLDTGKTRWPVQRLAKGSDVLINDGVRFDPSSLPLQFFRGDGKMFWTGLYQWDTASGRLLGGVDHQCERPGFGPGGTWPLTGLTVSADGRRVAVVGMRKSAWLNFDEKGKVTGSDSRVFETILVWELTAAGSGVKEDAPPLAGTPEQINLWLQAQTGRELWDDAQLPQGLPALGFMAVNNLRDDLWLQCREKLIATGGLPAQ